MKLIVGISLILIFSLPLSAQQNEIKFSNKNIVLHNINPVSGKTFHLVKKDNLKGKDFSFTVNPYLWTLGIGGSVQLPNTKPYDFNKSFSDAVKDWKMAAMIAGRFKYKRTSLIYDLVYYKFTPVLYVPIYSGYITGNSEIKQFIGDFFIAYNVPIKEQRTNIEFYGGARIWSMNTIMELTASNGLTDNTSNSKTWVDPVVGFGGDFTFSKKWFSYFKADLGGFSITSDWTSTFVWGFGYNFSPNWNTSLGFKNVYIDYDKDKFIWNVSQYGLLLTIGYRF